jgi:hypothetical protein
VIYTFTIYLATKGDWYHLKRLLCSRSLWHLLIIILFLVTIGLESNTVAHAATPISISSPYLTITVNATEVYTIIAQSPAWTFGGKIGHTLSNIAIHSGNDGVGSYQEIDFNYT